VITRLGSTARSHGGLLGGALGLALVFGGIGLDTGIAAADTLGPVTPATSPAAIAVFPSGAPSISDAPEVDSGGSDRITLSWPGSVDAAPDAQNAGTPASTLVVVVLPGEASGATPDAEPIAAIQPSAPLDADARAAAVADGSPFLDAEPDAESDGGRTVARIAGLHPETSYRFALRTVPVDPILLAAATTPLTESPATGPTTTTSIELPPSGDAPGVADEHGVDDPAAADATPATADPVIDDPIDETAPSPTGLDASARVGAAPGTPEAPKARATGGATIEVTWPAVSTGAAVVTYTVTVFRDDTVVRTVTGIDPLVAGTTTLVGGLLANTAYAFTVTAVGTEASSPPSASSAAVTTARGAPVAPTRPTLDALDDDPLGLLASWTPPASDGGYAITGYTVEVFTGSTVNLSNLVSRTEVPAARTSVELPRIGIVGSSLAFRVTASNGAGEAASSLSAGYRIAATAPVPTRVGTPAVADAPPGSLRVTWAAPTGATPQTGYLLRIAAADGLSTGMTASVVDLGIDFEPTGTLETTVENPAPGRTVSVQITAYESASLAGLIPTAYRTSSLRSAGTTTGGSSEPQRPDRPLSVTSDGVDRITVAGTSVPAAAGNGAPITAFDLVVYRAGSAQAVTTQRVPAVVSADDPSRLTHAPAVIAGLSKSTAYTVRAAAVNAAGVGRPSAVSAIVTTLSVPPPGSVPPSWPSLAALREAVLAGAVLDVAAQHAELATTVEPTTTLDPAFAWPGSGSASGGEVWLYGSADDDQPPVHLGLFTIEDGLARASVALGPVADGEYALAFIPTGGRAAAIEFTVAAIGGGPTEIDDAVLRWGFSDEANNGAFFGGCNFLTAGHIPDVGSGAIVDESRYSAQAGPVSIQKPNASGAYELASFATRCLDRGGSTVDSNVTTSFTDSQLVIVGGSGTVDPSTNSGTISWTGDFSVAFYGGLTFWYGSDPVLTVADGVGTLTATASGFGTDMADQTKWTRIPPREIVLATLVGVTMRSDGFTVAPSYVGVKIAQSDQVAPNSSNASYWGSFPQSFIDFQALTGQFSYWFTSGGRQDPGKVALPLTVGFDASTFVAVAPPGVAPGDAVDLVPSAKRSPFALKAPGAPAAAAATGVGQQVTEIITLIQPSAAPLPASQAVPLFIALLALLGGLTVVAAAGGGLIASGVLKP